MKHIAWNVSIVFALTPAVLTAQDGQGVRADPPYIPGSEDAPGNAPPAVIRTPNRPHSIWVLPWKPGSDPYGRAPWAVFQSPGPGRNGSVRYDVNVRVTQSMDEDDPSRYYMTPDVHVVSPANHFNFSSTFDRTYDRSRRVAAVKPQDEWHERFPLPLPAPAPAVPWITEGGLSGKSHLALELNVKDLEIGGITFDHLSLKGVTAGGGGEIAFWGGALRLGFSYIQGQVQTERVSSCQAVEHIGSGPPPPPSDDVIIGPGDGLFLGPGPGGAGDDIPLFPEFASTPEPACTQVRYEGTITLFEFDVFFALLEGKIDLGGGVALYSCGGPLVSIEYAMIEVANTSTEGWIFSAGAYLETGVRWGNCRVFCRVTASYGWGVGGIETSEAITGFAGLSVQF